MKLTRASSYALAAAVYLARQKNGTPVSSQVMAEADGTPERFLLKLLKPLVSAGLLRSRKGPGGGYALARPAKEITLLEVVEAVDGPIRGHVPGFEHSNRQLERQLEVVCTEVADRLRESLRKVSVADLAARR